MEIEEQILNEIAPTSVDRSEVRTWLESERTRMNRISILTFAGVVLLLGCLLGLVYQLLESESQKVKQLVGTHPTSNEIMIQELTNELCGQEPAKYFVEQISVIGSRGSSTRF